jgi:hypothetical protein
MIGRTKHDKFAAPHWSWRRWAPSVLLRVGQACEPLEKVPADSMTWSAAAVTLDLNENPGHPGGASRKLIQHAAG